MAPLAAEALREIADWTDNASPALLVWVVDDQLVGVVTDLRIAGADHAGRMRRARCLVIAQGRENWGHTLGQLAGLVVQGLPAGYLVALPAGDTDPLGFRVSSAELPRLGSPASGDGVGSPPPNGRQRCFAEVPDAARWLAALAEDPASVPSWGPHVMLGSPMLDDETRGYASKYTCTAGPGLRAGTYPKVPEPPPPEGGSRSRFWGLAVACLFLTALALALLLGSWT